MLLLAREGGRAVLDKRVDTVHETVVLQPDEPGYLELVGVTPTLLSLHTHNGELTGVAFIARTGVDAGGGVVLLPADLQVAPGVGYVRRGELISEVFARGGADAVEQVAEGLFGLGFDDVEEITTESLAHSMGPAAPVPYLLVDDLSETVPTVGRGWCTRLAPTSCPRPTPPRCTPSATLTRPTSTGYSAQRALWESWLGVIGRADDPAAAAPPPSSVLSAFMRALGSGTAVVEVPPLHPVLDPALPPRSELGDDGESWLRDRALELVPWPRQPESFLRPRVQLLDGTGDPSIRDALADDVVAAGGVITVMGNAAEFGVEATHFAYHREELVNGSLHQLHRHSARRRHGPHRAGRGQPRRGRHNRDGRTGPGGAVTAKTSAVGLAGPAGPAGRPPRLMTVPTHGAGRWPRPRPPMSARASTP